MSSRQQAMELVKRLLHEMTPEEDDDLYEWTENWAGEAGSAVEIWGTPELKQEIRSIVDGGGVVKTETVEPDESYFRSQQKGFNPAGTDIKSQLGVTIGCDEPDFNVKMAKQALAKISPWLKRGYEVLGYCDNADQGEIIYAKRPTDSTGSGDVNDIIVDLWNRAKTSTGPEKDKLMARINRLRPKS